MATLGLNRPSGADSVKTGGGYQGHLEIVQIQADYQRIGPYADSFIELRCLYLYLYLDIWIYMSPPHVIYFKTSHWPSDPMISPKPLIGQSCSPPLPCFFFR